MSANADLSAYEGGGVDGPAPFGGIARDQLIMRVGRPLIRRGYSRLDVTTAVNEELIEHGHKPLSPGSVYRILAYGKNLSSLAIPGAEPKKKRKTKQQQREAQRRSESNAVRASIRRADTRFQYESMMNAPANKLNNPLIRRAEAVQHTLIELMALDPEVAVTQIPIERCRQWTPESAEWWSRFTQLCEERRQRETPDIQPMAYPRREVLDPRPAMPTQEYQLSPNQAMIYSWLKGQIGPKTIVEVMEATGMANGSVNDALNRMETLRMVRRIDVTHPFLFEVIVN